MQESVPADLDFNTDVTELESFASTPKPPSASPAEIAPAKPAGLCAVLSEYLKMEKESEWAVNGSAGEGKGPAKEQRTAFCGPKTSPSGSDPRDVGGEENSPGKGLKPAETVALAKGKNPDCDTPIASAGKYNISEESGTAEDTRSPAPTCCTDTDEEPLIIDAECETGTVSESCVVTPPPGPEGPAPPPPGPGQALSGKLDGPPETHEPSAPGRLRRRLSQKVDPVGQILKLQAELLKPPSPNCQGHLRIASGAPPSSASPSAGPSAATDAGSCSTVSQAACYRGPQKGLLWDAAEDGADCEPPQGGNLVYKLFSLGEVLLLVRSTVQKVELRPHQKRAKFRRHFPVYVLPKLEYQAFYGAETLTEDEVCRLWAESLLHSNSSFTVGHIDALTSQLFLLERLTGDALRKRFGTFKPANSLNILQNILKKVTGLQEGSYLLSHLAGDSSVTVYKSCSGNATRAVYNLHAAHADLPPAPAALSVPWVPLDASLPLPQHFAQGRVPCTFPPKPAEGPNSPKMSGGTPSHRGPVAMEAEDGCPLAKPRWRGRGAAQNGACRRRSGPASRGPNWKFWKKARTSAGHTT